MGFNVVLNTEPWYQWTYGVLYSNWNQGNQTIALLDNGELWACFDNFHMASQEEQAYAAWVGTVSPDGAERKMGDLWARHPAILGSGDDHGLKTTDTYAPRSNMYAAVRPSDIFTDGTTIYLLQQQDYDYGAGKGAGIWSLDPNTLALEHVAFDLTEPATGEYYEDNHDAKLAVAAYPRKPIWWNGAFYFWDNLQRSGTHSTLGTLRRWEPGAGVSTVTPSLNTPTGYTGTTWLGAINTSTGLINGLNDDVMHVTADYMCSAIHNDWMYMLGLSGYNISGGLRATWIRRLDMNNPDNGIETLYYGIDDAPSSTDTIRDWVSDFESTPTGLPYPTDNPTYRSASLPGLGTPQLLGFLPDPAYGGVCVLGDDLIFLNDTTNSFYTAWNVFGQMICAINIPELLAAVENNDGKPLRHDRTNPFFRTIVGGSTNDHGYTYHNQQNRWAVWLMMDGGNPNINHVNPGSLITNPNADGWGNKVLYLANSIDNSLSWASWAVNTQAHFVKVLEPKGATDRDFEVTFSFEGRVLKGYAPAVGIEQAYAPEEIILQ